MTPADLAAVVADWCEANGVGRVDLAIALLGAEVEAARLSHRRDGTSKSTVTKPRGKMRLSATTGGTRSDLIHDRAAALAVAAMRCDLEGR